MPTQRQPPQPQFQIETQRDFVPMRPIRYRDAPPPTGRSAPGPPVPAPTPAQGERFVNVALEDQPADAILQVGTWYTLAVDVDVAMRADVLTGSALRRRIAVRRLASTRPP